MSPAVKGVQQAHGSFLVVGGAGLHNGADQHFDQTAAHGINDDAGHQPHKRGGEKFGQEGQPDQPCARADMSDDDGYTVTDFINKCRGYQVDHELQAKVKGHKEGDPGEGNSVGRLKG